MFVLAVNANVIPAGTPPVVTLAEVKLVPAAVVVFATSLATEAVSVPLKEGNGAGVVTVIV